MNTYKKLLLSFFFFSALNTFAQSKVETTFKVDGVCGMCKDRIENTLDVSGVWVAEWDIKTHELYCVYKPEVITIEEIHQLLNNAGHDTELSKAPEEKYMAINPCCHYRDPEVVESHQ